MSDLRAPFPASVLLQGASDWAWAIALALSFGAAVWWLYPGQLQKLSRRWRILLPALRVTAIVALALAVIKPVLLREKTVAEAGAVVVLVDRSASMQVVDSSRSPAERVRLASGLGLLSVEAQPGAIGNLLADVQTVRRLSNEIARASADTDYARLAGQGAEAAQKRLDDKFLQFRNSIESIRAGMPGAMPGLAGARVRALSDVGPPRAPIDAWLKSVRDASGDLRAALIDAQATSDQSLYDADPNVRRTGDAAAEQTRASLVTRALSGFDQSLLRSLPSDVPVYSFALGDRVRPDSLAVQLATSVTQPTTEATATDQEFGSDLIGGVRSVVEKLNGIPLLGVVLLSDGRQVGSSNSSPQSLTELGVPVYTVGVAPRVPPRDVSIARVTLPSSAFTGESVTVRADVRGTGLQGESIDVSFECAGERQTKKIKLQGGSFAQAEFLFKPSTAGALPITINAAGFENEAQTRNNTVSRMLKVKRDRVHVAMITPAATWDYQYIRNALSRSSWADVSNQILLKADSVPTLSPEDILKQQVLILHDVKATLLSAAQWEAVHKLVTDRGGSVIVLAGHDIRQTVKAGGESGKIATMIAGLLPFESADAPAWRVWPGATAQYRLIPTPVGLRIDALRLDDDVDAGRAWEQLPGFFRLCPVAKLKPNARALLVDRESGEAVLTESRVGSGRVFYFGADETWRWRAKVGERDQDRFWTQLVRYGAEEPYALVDGNVSLDADKVVAEPRESIQVRARVLDDNGQGVVTATQMLQVWRGNELFASYPMLMPTTDANGRYVATLSDLPVGLFDLTLGTENVTTRPSTRATTPSLRVIIERNAEAELVDLSGDEEFLRAIASATGGDYLNVDQIAQLPDRLSAARNRQSRFVETRLWDSPYLFLLVLGCLGAEWAIRKRLGLS